MPNYLQNLSATKATDYSLWKATKNICKQTSHSSVIKKDNGNWAKSDAEKAETFANHLSDVLNHFLEICRRKKKEYCLKIKNPSISPHPRIKHCVVLKRVKCLDQFKI